MFHQVRAFMREHFLAPGEFVAAHLRRGHKSVLFRTRKRKKCHLFADLSKRTRPAFTTTQKPSPNWLLQQTCQARDLAARARGTLVTLPEVVLVITEDAAGAAELPRLLERLGIRAELLDCARHALRISIPLAVQIRVLDADTENAQSLINLLAAAQAAAVVGTFSSGYSRLIFELACARAGRIVPHHSLDLKYFV
jgi:hypothetical protein